MVLSACGASMTTGVAVLTVPLNSVLGEALNNTNLLWASVGSAFWFAQNSISHDGVGAAQSGSALYDGQDSWLETTVSGPGTVAFWWKVSSAMDDPLEFYLGGVRQSVISGKMGWEQLSFTVPAGNQTLRWRYVRGDWTVQDMNGYPSQDCGWLDEVVFQPQAGLPVILAQPVNRKAGLADTVTFTVGVAGEMPLTYQWMRDETNVIAGATDATLTLARVGFGSSSAFSAVVSNRLGSAVSASATLQVTTNGPVGPILLVAQSWGSSPYRTALTNLGWSYQEFSDSAAFQLAVSEADPATTLVVVGEARGNFLLSPLADFAKAGGRVLLEYWGLCEASPLAAALDATVVERNLPSGGLVYDWGGSPFFTGLTSPVNAWQWNSLYDAHGQWLQPIPGGQAVAGYDSVPTASQAAIVIGHSGRTILNGFLLEEASGLFTPDDGLQIALNELEFLIRPLAPIIIDCAHLPDAQFQLVINGQAGASYSVLASLDLTAWEVLGMATEISPGVFEFTDAEAPNHPTRFYRLSSP